MKVIAIDPGNTYSAYCIMDSETLRPYDFGKAENSQLRRYFMQMEFDGSERAVIEMVASYGMSVGKDVFDTCRWIGRFEEILTRRTTRAPELVYRMEEKMHICHNSKAGDANIRRALIDRFCTHDLKNGKGTKKNPDFFHGFAADVWAAYAAGLTYIETRLNAEE